MYFMCYFPFQFQLNLIDRFESWELAIMESYSYSAQSWYPRKPEQNNFDCTTVPYTQTHLVHSSFLQVTIQQHTPAGRRKHAIRATWIGRNKKKEQAHTHYWHINLTYKAVSCRPALLSLLTWKGRTYYNNKRTLNWILLKPAQAFSSLTQKRKLSAYCVCVYIPPNNVLVVC